MGHGVSDKAYNVREDLANELKEWQDERDPINVLRETILSQHKDAKSELIKLEEKATKVVEDAVKFAIESPIPTYEDLISNVYVENS
jgi:pyruvate dehydrogenase E1 component alpha subunit